LSLWTIPRYPGGITDAPTYRRGDEEAALVVSSW
jgi:hypothetical protein